MCVSANRRARHTIHNFLRKASELSKYFNDFPVVFYRSVGVAGEVKRYARAGRFITRGNKVLQAFEEHYAIIN